MMKVRAFPTLMLALMGSMDCLTTVLGILYFGAIECNPLIAGLVSTNIGAFIILKLTSTVLVCIIFVQAEKILMKTQNKESKAFSRTRRLLKISHVGVTVFLVVVVINNLIVLTNAF